MERLTHVLQVRVTASLVEGLRREAQRLNLRPADVARMAIAQAVANKSQPAPQVSQPNEVKQ